ncbi:hypothetical protein [Embleya sp. NPDC059259]|uniref:hypothetical protein n=1 Tax=unclassified Embleya TaxID=2699296 RepID=UPI00369CAA6B
MTTGENEPTTETADPATTDTPRWIPHITWHQTVPREGARQEPAAATEARDRLLRAIGREAEHVADTQPGQASKALAELAHAYALVAAHATTADPAAAGEGIDARNVSMGVKVMAGQEVFECKPFPESGYCKPYAPTAAGFEPGVGAHWNAAWEGL